MKNKIICIILARGGSKGLKNKNLRILDGKPLIARAIMDAKNSEVCDDILVSTDSNEIAEIAVKYGAKVPFLRPKELAEDLTTTEESLQNALLSYEKLKDVKFDICLFLTCTDVFRDIRFIKKSIQLLNEDPKLESVFVGSPTHKNYWRKNKDGSWVRVLDYMKTYSSRQVREFIVREDTGIACASRANLWRQGKRIGDNVEIILNEDPYSHVDIHSIDDLKLAQLIIDLNSKNE